jgi:hypothetical protein
MTRFSICLLLIAFITSSTKAQDNQHQNSREMETGQKVYSDGVNSPNKIMIVPFDSKMYVSSVDRSIAKRTGLSYSEIKENLRYGITDQLLLKTKGKIRAVSIMQSDTGYAHKELMYIYNSIGYKYKMILVEENEEPVVTKKDKLKSSFQKLIKKEDGTASTNNTEYERGRIQNGEIHTTYDYADRYMHTSIHNPNLLNTLAQNYNTDMYVFINELDIEESKSGNSNMISSDSYRKIKVHYTVFDQQGNDIKGGAAVTYMPSYVNDLNKIVNIYFGKIAEEICNSLPNFEPEKHVLEKEKEDAKKAAAQRSEIEKY